MLNKENFLNFKIFFLTVARIYLGWQWLSSGLGKVTNPVWFGENAGVAVRGFLQGALTKTEGAHPEVQAWYGYFIENVALPNASIFSYMVVIGEILAGISLLLGALTVLGLLGGGFMNLNFLLAGTSSSNPIMLILTIILLYDYKLAQKIGLDNLIFSKIYPKFKSYLKI